MDLRKMEIWGLATRSTCQLEGRQIMTQTWGQMCCFFCICTLYQHYQMAYWGTIVTFVLKMWRKFQKFSDLYCLFFLLLSWTCAAHVFFFFYNYFRFHTTSCHLVLLMDLALLFFPPTNVHVLHLVFQIPSPSGLCHLIPSTSMHLPSHTKPLIYSFLVFWKSVFWFATSRMKTPGLWKSRGGKKQGLFFVLYFYISLFYALFTFLTLFSVFPSLVGSWSFKWTKSLESI